MTKKTANLMMAAALLLGVIKLNTAMAEMKATPDENTLWIEDGQKVQTGEGSSDQYWNIKWLNITNAPGTGGGILFDSPNSNKCNTGRYVPFDPAFPYLVWEISQITPGQGYQSFSLRILKNRDQTLDTFFSTVTHLQTGLFTVNTSYSNPESKQPFLRLDLHNTQMTMKYLKLVRQPENYLDVSSPLFATKKGMDISDEVTFNVVLAEAAEDVSLRFFDWTIAPLTVNGSQTLQLKAQDDHCKVWTGKLKFESCTGATQAGVPFPAGSFIVKAVILGGKLGMPIWTANPVEFRINTTAK